MDWRRASAGIWEEIVSSQSLGEGEFMRDQDLEDFRMNRILGLLWSLSYIILSFLYNPENPLILKILILS